MSHGFDLPDEEDQAIGGFVSDLVITEADFEGVDPSKVLQVNQSCANPPKFSSMF